VRATPRSPTWFWWMSSAIVWAKSRGLAVAPVYSLESADCRVDTCSRRTSTRKSLPTRRTDPITRPSAPSSRQRSKGTSVSDRAAGIDW